MKEEIKRILPNIYDTEISVLLDDFTWDRTIMFTKVSGQKTEYFKLYRDKAYSFYQCLGFSFITHNEYSYLSVFSGSDGLSLAKGDSVIILFEDKTKIEFSFKTPSKGEKNNYVNSISLASEMLEIFLTKKIDKVKITSLRKSIYVIYSLDVDIKESPLSHDFVIKFNQYPQYSSREEGQELLQIMTRQFIQANKDELDSTLDKIT